MVEDNTLLHMVVSLEGEMEDVLKIDGRVSGLKGNKMSGIDQTINDHPYKVMLLLYKSKTYNKIPH